MKKPTIQKLTDGTEYLFIEVYPHHHIALFFLKTGIYAYDKKKHRRCANRYQLYDNITNIINVKALDDITFSYGDYHVFTELKNTWKLDVFTPTLDDYDDGLFQLLLKFKILAEYEIRNSKT